MAILDERREVARWAADSAERVLPLFEAIAPSDARPREAIAISRAFSDGAGRSRHLFRVALAAHRAGREIDDPVGLAAARAASLAAATANIHGEATIGTLGHILGPAPTRPSHEDWRRAATRRRRRSAWRSSMPRGRSASYSAGSRQARPDGAA
jgi:hypothetical protein